MWIVNQKLSVALDLVNEWGYKLIDDITWIKVNENGRYIMRNDGDIIDRISKNHGFYLQHAKETCLVFARV